MDTRRAWMGWTVVRVVFGLVLATHGWAKVSGDMAGFAQGVAGIGFPFPLFFAWCAALSELVGGLLVALGLVTRVAGLFAAFTMVVAIYTHFSRGDPFGKMEMGLLYLSVMVAAVLIGGGLFSVDAKLRRRL